MPAPEPQPPRSGGAVVFGIALLVIGLLIAIPSGLCAGTLGVIGVLSLFTSGNSDFWDMLPYLAMVLIVFAIGFGLIWAGRRLSRRR